MLKMSKTKRPRQHPNPRCVKMVDKRTLSNNRELGSFTERKSYLAYLYTKIKTNTIDSTQGWKNPEMPIELRGVKLLENIGKRSNGISRNL